MVGFSEGSVGDRDYREALFYVQHVRTFTVIPDSADIIWNGLFHLQPRFGWSILRGDSEADRPHPAGLRTIELRFPHDRQTGRTLAHLFEKWVPYYRMKAAVAEALQPKTVLEIGVRHGHGGAAFLHGSPQAHYTGIDLDADTFGGEKGAIGWARHIMPAGQCDLEIADSQKLTRFPGGIYDLIHADGQQNESGTFHDLLLAIRQARYILVDGYFGRRKISTPRTIS